MTTLTDCRFSKVFYSDFKISGRESVLTKVQRLMRKAGIEQIDFTNKFTAIKMHFGEPGNLSYLRPNYAKAVADVVRESGGKPFLTDCNTLYIGRRKDGLEHITSAYENGFTPFSTGCHVIIGDGIKGTDDVEIPVEGGEYIKNAKIGKAIADADVFISLTHFKGHEMTGIGGALKNIGMGCGSRAGKMEMHSTGKPLISAKRCRSCGACVRNCAHGAITINEYAQIDQQFCVGCGRCIGSCPFDAVYSAHDETGEILCCKIAEYSKAVVWGKPHFHISIVCDVSPRCDCHGRNDEPIVPDVGIFASFDPVALDVACAEAVDKVAKTSSFMKSDRDIFGQIHPSTNWRACTDHGKKIGLGQTAYKLIKV